MPTILTGRPRCIFFGGNAHPFHIEDGVVNYEMGGIHFQARLQPNGEFHDSIQDGWAVRGQVNGNNLTATVENEYTTSGCKFGYRATKLEPFGSQPSSFDGRYSITYNFIENISETAKNMSAIGGNLCYIPISKGSINRGVLLIRLGSYNWVSAGLNKDGTFGWKDGGWSLNGSVIGGSFEARLITGACVEDIKATKIN